MPIAWLSVEREGNSCASSMVLRVIRPELLLKMVLLGLRVPLERRQMRRRRTGGRRSRTVTPSTSVCLAVKLPLVGPGRTSYDQAS